MTTNNTSPYTRLILIKPKSFCPTTHLMKISKGHLLFLQLLCWKRIHIVINKVRSYRNIICLPFWFITLWLRNNLNKIIRLFKSSLDCRSLLRLLARPPQKLTKHNPSRAGHPPSPPTKPYNSCLILDLIRSQKLQSLQGNVRVLLLIVITLIAAVSALRSSIAHPLSDQPK